MTCLLGHTPFLVRLGHCTLHPGSIRSCQIEPRTVHHENFNAIILGTGNAPSQTEATEAKVGLGFFVGGVRRDSLHLKLVTH